LWRLGRSEEARQVLHDHIAHYRVSHQVELRNRSEHVRVAMSRERSIEHHDSDELTGVRNRRYLDRCIPEAMAANDVASVAVVDLDHFGSVNQRYGYVAGDLVLQEVATMLERVCRRGDVVARMEKDHFAMVLRGASLGDARRVFERVRQMIASRVWSALPSDVRLTASIGVTVATSGMAVDDVIAAATAAMEASQRAGRDQLTLG
jgi:two-component system cell cycle response regulator